MNDVFSLFTIIILIVVVVFVIAHDVYQCPSIHQYPGIIIISSIINTISTCSLALLLSLSLSLLISVF
jgi:hypothetical protein